MPIYPGEDQHLVCEHSFSFHKRSPRVLIGDVSDPLCSVVCFTLQLVDGCASLKATRVTVISPLVTTRVPKFAKEERDLWTADHIL